MADTTTAPTAPASLPNYLAEGLPKQETAALEDIREYVDELIEDRERPIADDELPDDAEPVDDSDDTDRKGALVKERVKCSADCTCNDGRGHGPYVYRYYRTDGTLTSEYVGKA